MSSIERQIIAVVTALLVMATGAVAGGDTGGIPTAQVRVIPLAGPLATPEAEVSGMTWQGDTLVILPQFPDKFAADGMLGFFAVSKARILNIIDGGNEGPLEPHQVLCQAPGLEGIVQGFDGLEAMGCIGDRYYMTVEAKDDTVMAGFLVSGKFSVVDNMVIMDLRSLHSIPMGLNIFNVAEEAIVIDGDRVITLSEANGRNVNPQPRAKVFNSEAEFTGYLPMPQIEYRVTDATALDEEGRFWVLNYFFPPEGAKLNPAPDPELERFGDPASYDPRKCIERLIELRLTPDDRIVRTQRPPINLELRTDGECRNWEALVRLDDRGFLLMTDKYPGTILAFVPLPN